jgi:RNA polymerase sigma-70 factor (ECF subfamily)
MDEAQILEGLKNRDSAAFNLLFKLLFHQLTFFLNEILNDTDEAEDIAIQSLVKFWEKGAGRFENFFQVRKFLFKTARNSALNQLKKNKNQLKHQKILAYLSSATEEELEERYFYRLEMMQKMLKEQVDKLPEQTREAFKLVFIERIPRPEAAQRLNITPGTLNVHCANALKKLRQIFSEKELIVLLLLFSTTFCSESNSQLKNRSKQIAGKMQESMHSLKKQSQFHFYRTL